MVTTDIGDAIDLHPRDKQDLGARLASTALHVAYGDASDLSPPIRRRAVAEGRHIRITFDHADSGLMVGSKTGLNPVQELPSGTLTGFAIAGANKNSRGHRRDRWPFGDRVVAPDLRSGSGALRMGNQSALQPLQPERPSRFAVPYRFGIRLNVVRGNGGGTFPLGTTVTITAAAPPGACTLASGQET